MVMANLVTEALIGNRQRWLISIPLKSQKKLTHQIDIKCCVRIDNNVWMGCPYIYIRVLYIYCMFTPFSIYNVAVAANANYIIRSVHVGKMPIRFKFFHLHVSVNRANMLMRTSCWRWKKNTLTAVDRCVAWLACRRELCVQPGPITIASPIGSMCTAHYDSPSTLTSRLSHIIICYILITISHKWWCLCITLLLHYDKISGIVFFTLSACDRTWFYFYMSVYENIQWRKRKFSVVCIPITIFFITLPERVNNKQSMHVCYASQSLYIILTRFSCWCFFPPFVEICPLVASSFWFWKRSDMNTMTQWPYVCAWSKRQKIVIVITWI